MDRVVRLQPKSVMDIGVGYGKWGLLLRESLDWGPGRLDRVSWQTRIDGIEAFPYASPLHSWVYDTIIQQDVLHCVDIVKDYDLVLMNDVIEHIEKVPAMDLIRSFTRSNSVVIISTPVEFFTQEIADNDYEQHVSHWALEDFKEFTFDFTIAGNAAIVVSLAGISATWPTLRDKRASQIAYTTPWVRSRPTLANLLSTALKAALV